MTRPPRRDPSKREIAAVSRFYAAASGRPAPELPKQRLRKPSDQRRIMERDVLKAVLAYLRRHPKVAMVYRVNSGVFQVPGKGSSVRYVAANGARGMADIMGTLKDGRTLACECKSPDGVLQPHQREFLTRVSTAGGVAFVARSVDDAITALNGA